MDPDRHRSLNGQETEQGMKMGIHIIDLFLLERETGFEPATSSLGSWHSTTELLPPSVRSDNLNEPIGLPLLSMVSIQNYRFGGQTDTKTDSIQA
jgi:hypothetical protein